MINFKNFSPTTAPTTIINPMTLRATHGDTLREIATMLRHPRSLARPTSTWRPPTKKLPRIDGGPHLTMAISRHRVGPRVQARMQGWGETRTPAYLMTVRLTDPAGLPAPRQLAEGWVRALLPNDIDHTVHEISSQTALTYVWLVDGDFTPMQSPASLFEGVAAA